MKNSTLKYQSFRNAFLHLSIALCFLAQAFNAQGQAQSENWKFVYYEK